MVNPAYHTSLEGPDLALIGYISVLWSQVEFLVDFATFQLLGLSFDEGRIQQRLRDISRRARALGELAKKLEEPNGSRILRLCGRVEELAPSRNLIVHGNWGFDTMTGQPAAVSWFKVDLGQALNVLHASELPEMLSDVAQLGLNLRKSIENLGFLPNQ